MKEPCMADGGEQQRHRRWLVAATLVGLAGVPLVLSGLSLASSLVGLAAAMPLFLLFSPVLLPAGLLASLLTAGAAISGVLAFGALSLLYMRSRRPDYVEEGKRRVGELATVAGEKTPHAALAVVNRGQSATDHKKPDRYEHYVAGRMVRNAC